MTTREQKILALTKNELIFLIDSPERLKDISEFFASGGYINYTDDELNERYQLAIDEGIEP